MPESVRRAGEIGKARSARHGNHADGYHRPAERAKAPGRQNSKNPEHQDEKDRICPDRHAEDAVAERVAVDGAVDLAKSEFQWSSRPSGELSTSVCRRRHSPFSPRCSACRFHVYPSKAISKRNTGIRFSAGMAASMFSQSRTVTVSTKYAWVKTQAQHASRTRMKPS